MNLYYTYVLKSLKDNKLYVGYTGDLKKRLDEHKSGLVQATKNRLPIELVYFEACRDKKSAIQREKQLKTGFGRAYLKRRLGDKFISRRHPPATLRVAMRAGNETRENQDL